MRYKHILSLFTLIIMIPFLRLSSTVAQKIWTLDECISYAQNHNISIKRQDLQIESSRSSLLTSRAQRLPRVNAWASHNLSSGKTVNIENYTYINTRYQDGSIGIQGDIALFEGLGIINIIKQENYNFQAAVQESEKLKNSITVQVTSAFLMVLFTEELLTVTTRQCELSKLQIESTAIFVEQGKLARFNLLDVQAQSAQDELLKTESQSALDNASLQLIHLMNLPDKARIKIHHPQQKVISITTLPDPGQLFIIAPNELPRVKGAKLKVKASESGLAVARSKLSPKLSLNGLIYSRYSDLGVDPLNPAVDYLISRQLHDNSYKRISLNLNFPVFNQLQTRNAISQAKIASMDAKLALDMEKNTLRQEIQQSYSDARNALTKYNAAQKALKAIQLSFDFAKERFSAGLSTSLDYKVVKTQLIKTEADLLQAKYEYILRSKILDFYRGIPII